MLVLSRRVGQVIRIGDDVAVRVLQIDGDQVRLGIEAPADVAVDRDEVRQRPGYRGRDGREGGGR